MTKNKFDFGFQAPAIIFIGFLIALIAIAVFVESYEPKEGEVPVATLALYGEVIDVSSCHSGKYILDCQVKVVKNGRTYQYRMDVTNYPGNTIQKGDVLGIETLQYAESRETGRYRNGRVRSIGRCLMFMPCWDEEL